MKKSLIPFLIVVGLGLVLVAMVRGPVARQKRLTSCQANLKQISLAMFQYVRDYDEKLHIVTNWQDALAPYHRSPTSFRCPETSTYYATNRYYSGIDIKYDKTISDTPLYYDSTSLKENAFDIGTSWPVRGAHFRMSSPYDWQGTAGSNVCYADGHVKWERTKPKFRVIGPTFPPLPKAKKQASRT
jgi:prepilin-type processing-associated H-X9-DG protein